MDTEEEEEDDDPTSALFDNDDNDELKIDNDNGIDNHISDDILFLCFQWLFASELVNCQIVNKHWNESAKDNHLWRIHCSHCFNRVSTKNLNNKYNGSYYEYYKRHKKLRFDGIYVIKVLYFIESEKTVPTFEPNQRQRPYTEVEYYRYVRFFNDNNKNCIYSLSRRKPTKFQLINSFKPLDCAHRNIEHNLTNSTVIASYSTKIDGILLNEKVFKAKYNVLNKKHVHIDITTDYGLKLKMDLLYDETIKGKNDRLLFKTFDGVCLDNNGNEMHHTIDHYEIRHEPFYFIPDTQFKQIAEYFP